MKSVQEEDGRGSRRAAASSSTKPRPPTTSTATCWTITGKLETPPELPNFDYRQYLARQGIGSIAYYPEVALERAESGKRSVGGHPPPATRPVVGAGGRLAGAAGVAGAGHPAGGALRPASRPEGRPQRDEHLAHHRPLRLQRDAAGGARHRRLRLAHRTAPGRAPGAGGHRRLHAAHRRLAEPRAGGDNGRPLPDGDAARPAQQRPRLAARRRCRDGRTAARRRAGRLVPAQLCRDGRAHRARAPAATSASTKRRNASAGCPSHRDAAWPAPSTR